MEDNCTAVRRYEFHPRVVKTNILRMSYTVAFLRPKSALLIFDQNAKKLALFRVI